MGFATHDLHSSLSRHARRLTPIAVRTVAIGLTLLAGAGTGASQHSVSEAAARVRRWFQVGEASWYGRAVQGHRTASGERFDMGGMTCAHRTLPLGSWLRVTNLSNRRSVLVRVTDRGPLSSNRVVDLSYAAAHAVGIGGVGKVQLEPLNPSDPLIAATVASTIAGETKASLGWMMR